MPDTRSPNIVKADARKRARLARRNRIKYAQQRLYVERTMSAAQVAERITREYSLTGIRPPSTTA